MENQSWLKSLISEIKEASPLKIIAFAADIFTIIGISFVAFFAKPVAEWILKRQIDASNFFFFGGILLFWTLVFLAILIAFTNLKKYFEMFKMGLLFYYGLILVYWFFGFAIISSLGAELVSEMFNL